MTQPDALTPPTGATPVVGPGADLRGARLAGKDLSGQNLAGCDLTDADLTDANLSGAFLTGAKLAGATLHAANLEGAQLLGADLTEVDLAEAKARGAVFGKAELTNASLFGADLSDASLTLACLENADLRAATLAGARLRGSGLRGTDLSRTDLRGADLTEADVHNARFVDADLREARVRMVVGFDQADWIGVDITGVDFAGAYMLRRVIIDQNYLHEFRTRGRLSRVVYWIWWITSDCGRSFGRWAAWTALLAVAFAGLYTQVPVDYGDYQTALSPLYFSVVTLTTLGYGDVLPASLSAQVLVLAEVVTGYVMLGGLLAIFATKMGRRAE